MDFTFKRSERLADRILIFVTDYTIFRYLCTFFQNLHCSKYPVFSKTMYLYPTKLQLSIRVAECLLHNWFAILDACHLLLLFDKINVFT